jgi:nucleotide-binding universal stress UspA family protein
MHLNFLNSTGRRVDGMWKVLAPVDLRFDTEAQVEYAAGVAGVLGAELSLLHVSTARWYQHSHRLGWPSSAWGSRTPDLDIHRLVLPGPVPETIARYADHIDADLLLVTTRTYGSRTRPWRKSISAEIMRATRRPVLIRKEIDVDLGGCFGCRRILCVLGLDGQDGAVLQHAQDLAVRTSGELILLHVVPPVSEGLLAYGLPNSSSRPLSAGYATRKLAELTRDMDVPVRTSVLTGSAAKCIASAARENVADLVLTARMTPDSPFERSGAYTADLRAILSALSCPLLTVPLGGLPVSKGTHPIEHGKIMLSETRGR